MNNNENKIKHILNPRSIAVVGASDKPGPGSAVLLNLINSGFAGDIYPVNPNRDSVYDLKCYESLDQIENNVDLVVAATPFQTIPELMNVASQKKVKCIMIFASGYAEIEAQEGKERQNELIRLSKELDIPIIGPNCLGFISTQNKVGATTIPLIGSLSNIQQGNVALISQSGGLLISALDRGNSREVGFRYLVSSGNEATLSSEDYVRYLSQEDEVQVIALIMEGIHQGRSFMDAVRLAKERGKKVVALKLGSSSIGQQAVRAHTGKLAGDSAVVKAAFDQSGIVQVESVDELIESCYLLSRMKNSYGNRMAAVMISGGTAALVSDYSEQYGIQLSRFSEHTKQFIKGILPDYASVNNPLDMTGPNSIRNPLIIDDCLQEIAKDPNVDLISFIFPVKSDGGPEAEQNFLKTVIAAGQKLSKPLIIMSTISGSLTNYWRETVRSSTIPILEDVNRGFKCLSQYLKMQKPLIELEMSHMMFDDLELKSDGKVLTEFETKRYLQKCGFPVTKEFLVNSYQQALEVTNELDFPISLKVMSPDIVHKFAAGVVRLNIKNIEDLRKSYSELESIINAKNLPNIDGILMQEMVASKLEVFIGGKYDEIFGPVILFGLGGVFVEAYNDVSLRIAPVSEDEATRMIYETKAIPRILEKMPDLNMKELAQMISKVSHLIAKLGSSISELDLNPVSITEDNQLVLLDGSIVCK